MQLHSIRQHILAPLWLRLPGRARWWVVDRLNRSDRYCWTDLVSDALTNREEDMCDVRLPAPESERCRTVCEWGNCDHSAPGGCGCYCGKFRFSADADGRTA